MADEKDPKEKNIVNLESDLRRIKGDLSSKNTVVLSLKSAAITNKKIISDLERTLEKRKKEVASQITTNERIVLELGNLKESMQKSDKEINKLKATKEEKQKKKENVQFHCFLFKRSKEKNIGKY